MKKLLYAFISCVFASCGFFLHAQCPPLEPIDGPNPVQACGNLTYTYSVPNSTDAGLVWTINPPLPVVGHFDGPSTGESVDIVWANLNGGMVQLCATPTNPCYPGPVCLDITVTSGPMVNDPPYTIWCVGDHVTLHFTGDGDYTYTWFNNNDQIGLPASGSGDLDFIAENPYGVPINAGIAVTAWDGLCRGEGDVFPITINPEPSVNPPSDVTVCGGTQVMVNFAGTAGDFSWENSNTAIGLGTSGTGNLNFTAAHVSQQEVAVITVTPMFDQCAGDPVTFTITVNPGPAMDPPPDVTACAGQPVSVQFAGQGTGFSWTNPNTAIGLGASGTGNLNFTAANVASPQTAVITVVPTGGACPGQPETFTISVMPLPTLTQPANVTVCGGAPVAVSFSGTAGADFSWTNSNPAIGLSASGTGNLDFSAAQVTQNETATISVTPVLDGCAGSPRTFQITVKPAPVLDAPPDVTVCAGEQVTADFETTPAGATFAWTNSNPAIGLGPSGTGDISFEANNWPLVQTATVTVTPTLNGCAGQPETFDISILPAPVADDPPDITVCENAPVSVVFSGTGGASYTWENSNTAIGLVASGSGQLLQFSAADVVGNSVAGTITVTPHKGGCAGEAVSFTVTVINCCATSAGGMDTASILVCGAKTVDINHLGNQNLEPDDTIRYILYSNPNNPLGSIVQYSDTLYFPFLPGVMHFDSAYYVAAIAGNQLANDSIDTTDPCFSLVKGSKIRWLQKPTISVSSPPAAVCRDGCVDVQFDFTGAPPFEFTWLVVQGGQVLLSKIETSAGYQMIVTFCTGDLVPPPAPGSIDFQVNFLMDKFCGCMD